MGGMGRSEGIFVWTTVHWLHGTYCYGLDAANKRLVHNFSMSRYVCTW